MVSDMRVGRRSQWGEGVVLCERALWKIRSVSVSVSIDEFKASLYCLMIYSAKRELKSSEPIVRYLYYRTKILDTYPEVRACVCDDGKLFEIVRLFLRSRFYFAASVSGRESVRHVRQNWIGPS